MIHAELQRQRFLQCDEPVRAALATLINELQNKPLAPRAEAASDLFALGTQIENFATAISAGAAAAVAAVPTVSSRTQAVGVRQIVIRTNVDVRGTPTNASLTIAPARTISSVFQSGPREITINYTGNVLVPGDSPTVAYTVPGSPQWQSVYGVNVATFAAQAVVVA